MNSGRKNKCDIQQKLSGDTTGIGDGVDHVSSEEKTIVSVKETRRFDE
jgi:hypothetical protein